MGKYGDTLKGYGKPKQNNNMAANLEVTYDLNNSKAAQELDSQLDNIIKNIEGIITGSDGNREEWVKKLVLGVHASHPGMGVMAIHPKHEIHGPNASWTHFHREFKKVWGTAGFEIYLIRPRSGTVVTNLGDGGFINWCFVGHSKRDGAVVTF